MKYIFTNDRELNVGTMYGIGQNYSKHAKEMGSVVPNEPIIFIKPPSAYIPDGGTIVLPKMSQLVHHEVELVAIIGKDCHNIKKEEAAAYIAGFAVGIDVTMRDVQNKAKSEGKPWAVSKGFATSAPISKVIPIELFSNINHPFNLDLKINGEIRQQASTSEMERGVDELLTYLSEIFKLCAGDCIFTGTPQGVGEIKAGDRIHAELKGYVALDVNAEL